MGKLNILQSMFGASSHIVVVTDTVFIRKGEE